VTCQTKKYPTGTYNENDDESLEVWTILSTASFAKKNKAPQEFLPEGVIQNVTKLLVESLENDLLEKIEDDSNSPGDLRNQILESRLQLWGAAVPLNVWRGDSPDLESAAGFIHDPRYQVGVCGDWLMEASIAGAWTSGQRMAQHLINADHSTASKYVGFKKGVFEASQSARQLGLASLEGPMNSEENSQSTQSSSQTTNNRGNGGGNNDKRKNNRNRSRSRKQTSVAEERS
jgi:hypothetical protein